MTTLAASSPALGHQAPFAESTAQFIGARADRGTAPVLSTTVVLDRSPDQVSEAFLEFTALGVVQAQINGRPTSAAVLSPGWTSYEWRLAVPRHEVTDLVRDSQGVVKLSLLVGNGWYRGDMGFGEHPSNYGDQIGACARLQISYADGHQQQVVTDERWQAHTSGTTENSLYQGQTIDAGLRATPQALELTVLRPYPGELVPHQVPEVVRQEVITPQQVFTPASGHPVIDFGQNLVGWLRFTVQGPAGSVITVRHAEVLEDGELATAELRSARATDRYILSGQTDTFEPTLTFHGFRYAEIQGWPGDLDAGAIEAVVVGSALRRTGEFSCSEPLVNQLVHNSVWGQKGNFLSVPTDCPQRDERLGWTGDIAAFAATAAFQFDVADFLSGWLVDLRLETEHQAQGFVPVIIPDLFKTSLSGHDYLGPMNPTAIWGDAAIWVPQALWQAYGDLDRLAEQYPAMVLHLASVEKALSPTGLWDQGFQYGDWVDPDAPAKNPAAAKADPGVVATACLYRSARFATQAAMLLGLPTDAQRWDDLADRTRAAFNQHYVHQGRVQSDCVTVYSLAICFGLLDQSDQQAAGERLAELVSQARFRVSTGFAGTPFVTWALTRTGRTDLAYRLLLETECPSWLYPITVGATTIWERWDSLMPNGRVNPSGMTSFNHYALGAVVDWVAQVVGGIRPAEPGYARVLIQPEPGPGISWATTSYESAHGQISCHWQLTDGQFDLDVTLPDQLPATVALPDGSRHDLTGGQARFSCSVVQDGPVQSKEQG